MHTPKLRGLALLSLPLLFLLAEPAPARERPDAPFIRRVLACGYALTEKPAVCVQFFGPSEEVGFQLEWTENGVAQPSNLRGRATCLGWMVDTTSQCFALTKWLSGGQGRYLTYNKDRTTPEGFQVTDLAYDSEYCFRLRSIDRDGVWSEGWTNWECARTPLPPSPPSAPPRPHVTSVGTPAQALLEWPRTAEAYKAGWFEVEAAVNQGWLPLLPKIAASRFDDKTVFDATVRPADPAQRTSYRVCAVSIVGRACSPAAWYYPFAATKQSLGDQVTRQASSAAEKATSARNAGAQPAQPTGKIDLGTLDELARRGIDLAAADPLSAELRARAAEGAAQRGFDIGMAASDGQTQDGPGKQRIREALGIDEREGFDVALAFSLERNRNAALAAVGAGIAANDADVAAARAHEPDVFYWLGFDIASGIFGDSAAGAQGNTVMGPGAGGIRDGLGAAARRGFNAGMKFHLDR